MAGPLLVLGAWTGHLLNNVQLVFSPSKDVDPRIGHDTGQSQHPCSCSLKSRSPYNRPNALLCWSHPCGHALAMQTITWLRVNLASWTSVFPKLYSSLYLASFGKHSTINKSIFQGKPSFCHKPFSVWLKKPSPRQPRTLSDPNHSPRGLPWWCHFRKVHFYFPCQLFSFSHYWLFTSLAHYLNLPSISVQKELDFYLEWLLGDLHEMMNTKSS